MQKNMFFQASLLGLGAVVAACSSSSAPASTADSDSGPGTSTPSIAITAPANNGTLTLSSTKTGNITFTTTDFTLMAPGTCPADVAGQPPCGHVHVLIDGTACNDTASGAPYNVAANGSPAIANFALCPTADGAHTIVLELHNDDHTPYQVNGQTVSATISITTSG
jgi:hypothetical protein